MEHENDAASTGATLRLFGGLACVVFGVGLILTNRAIRGALGDVDPAKMVEGAIPDIQRYLRLRAM